MNCALGLLCHHLKVKGEGYEKEVYQEPFKSLFKTTKNMEKRNESSKMRFQRQTVGRY